MEIKSASPGGLRKVIWLARPVKPPGQPAMNKTKLIDDGCPPSAPEPLLLRPAEAARFLAISPRKLWELTNCREVPFIRIGRSLRYPVDRLRGWVTKRLDRRR
jgi:excisionase family DNA binding protein